MPSIQVSSVTSGTSDWRKNTVRFGSRPQARKSSATSSVFCAALGGVEQRGHRVVVGDEVERLALFLQLDGGLHHPEVIAEMQRARRLDA